MDKEPVWIDYTNWRGERAWRLVLELYRWWGQTDYHPDHQEFIRAVDLEHDVERDFATRDIHTMQPYRPGTVPPSEQSFNEPPPGP